MPADAPETRTLIHLRTGSKICVLVALCLVAVAVYFYFEPVSTRTGSGGVFTCGSAAHPATSKFQKNVCENLTDVDLYRTYLFAAIAVIVAAVGSWFFGVDRTEERRRPQFETREDPDFRPARPRRRRYDDEWDEVEDDLPPRSARYYREAPPRSTRRPRPAPARELADEEATADEDPVDETDDGRSRGQTRERQDVPVSGEARPRHGHV